MECAVKELRVAAELTQKQLGFRLGCSGNHMGRIERGERFLTDEQKQKLERIFGKIRIREACERSQMQNISSHGKGA